MKKRIVVTLFALALGVFATARSLQIDPPVQGAWIGQYMTESGWTAVSVRLWKDGDELKGTINIPSEGVIEAPLSWVMLESNDLHFELVRDSGTLVFDGRLEADRGSVSGTFSLPMYEGRFLLTRAAMAHRLPVEDVGTRSTD